MNYKEAGFREFYHHFVAVPLKANLLPLIKDYPWIEQADHILTYGYMDQECGMTLAVLGTAKETEDGFLVIDGNDNVHSIIRISTVAEDEVTIITEDDEALKKDLASLPLEVERLQALLANKSLSPVDCLERFLDENEKLSARVDGLANFIMCTLAVDATNADACAANDQLEVAFTSLELLSSAVTRYVAALPDLEGVIAASPKLQSIAFDLNRDRDHVNKFYFDNIEFCIDTPEATEEDLEVAEKIAAGYTGEEVPTAISTAKAAKAQTIFNVAGQQVKSLQKGLNIVNGEKVYVK